MRKNKGRKEEEQWWSKTLKGHKESLVNDCQLPWRQADRRWIMYVWYVPPSCCSTCFLHISCFLKRAIIPLQPWTLEEEEEEEEEGLRVNHLLHLSLRRSHRNHLHLITLFYFHRCWRKNHRNLQQTQNVELEQSDRLITSAEGPGCQVTHTHTHLRTYVDLWKVVAELLLFSCSLLFLLRLLINFHETVANRGRSSRCCST